MSFEEFEAVYNAYVTQRNFDIEGEWERMRLLASILLQPHLSKGANITPQKLIPLPWDEKHDMPVVERTAAEQRKRTKELVERLLKTNKNE